LLLELRVKNLGIIEDIDWHLHDGLNVITGETGAGKSLVLDAVELLLIGSASEEVIRHNASEARIEGVFIFSQSPHLADLHAFLSEKGLSVEEGTLVISFEIRRQKPGLIRINGQSVTRSVLRQVGRLLIDIHGQSEHLSLLDMKKHLDILDAFAHNMELRQKFSVAAAVLKELESELHSLGQDEKDRLRQIDFLQYQIAEIRKAKLLQGEDEELEKERRLIAHSQKIKEYTAKVYEALCGNDSGSRFSGAALSGLNEARQILKKLEELDPALNTQLDYLEKSYYGLEELARDVRAYGDQLDHNPQRLEEIESRLELIRELKRKYGKTTADILGYLAQAEKKLSALDLSVERRGQIEGQIAALKKEMGQLAGQLSEKRSQAAIQLSSSVINELQTLEMGQMQFAVSVEQTMADDGIEVAGGEKWAFSEDGADNVEFLVSTNYGEPLKPLVKIASTGEISRFTLAMKGVMSEVDNIPVLIFDEIDIGVGGRSGDILGKKLWALSRRHQVICITHLPQIAVYADAHYRVRKETHSGRTTSILEELGDSQRNTEVATMLAGADFSGTARLNAQELLQKAAYFKASFQNTLD
jgi:DNA repair protein RecN (Recombination protein N)